MIKSKHSKLGRLTDAQERIERLKKQHVDAIKQLDKLAESLSIEYLWPGVFQEDFDRMTFHISRQLKGDLHPPVMNPRTDTLTITLSKKTNSNTEAKLIDIGVVPESFARKVTQDWWGKPITDREWRRIYGRVEKCTR